MIKLNTTHNASYKKKAKKINIHDLSTTRRQSKNNGGFLGGLKYVGGNFVAGVGGVGEGIADLFAATGAVIRGDTEYAKYVFKDNQAGEWHQSLTEDYNPGKVMNFLGDVGHGLGQSSVFLLNAIPGLGQLGTAAFFTGIIGQGISNAADKTGDVGFKEVAYGVGTGVTEGILETYLGAAAKAAGSIGKGLVGNVAKNAVRRGLAKEILTGASEEFLEEAVGELTDVFWQRTTGVDKNASTSLKNAIYSGLVGAVSGGLSVGSTSVIKYGANQQRGKRIIQSGNAQTLVNTATSVADKLAGSGTDFKKADEWITALRGDVDAYNKLTAEQKTGAKGQTILGEMQAALAFAELQASFAGVQAKIENSDESTRAAFAEYINQTVHPSKRNKEYTAEDIAKNTDNVSWQIAVLDYVNGIADIDGAIAFEEAARAKVAGVNSGAASVINEGDSVIEGGEAVVENGKTVGETKYSLSKTKTDRLKGVISELGNKHISKQAGGKKITIQTDDYTVDKNIYSDKGRKKSEVNARIKNIDNFEQLLNQSEYVGTDTNIQSVEKDAKKGVVAIHKFKTSIDGYDIEFLVRDKGKNQYLYEAKFIENKKGSQQSIADNSASTAPKGDVENSKSIPQNEPVVNTNSKKNIEKHDLADKPVKNAQEGAEVSDKTVEGKTEEKSAENENDGEAAKKTAQETVNEPKISEAKESLTDDQRKARAIETARKWIEWEKQATPTAKELNSAREYVKDFDKLQNNRRLAILKMIRSADGKVDKKILKGVANIMAVNPKSDLEFRFADLGGSKRGLTTEIRGKTVIVIDGRVDFNKTVKRTIAHELVHYLENRAGYEDFAEYVMKRAKPEAKEEIAKKYTDFYRSVFTAEALGVDNKTSFDLDSVPAEVKIEVEERLMSKKMQKLIDSEITASLVGEALQSETFLKRYANRDRKFIAKVGSWLKQITTRLKMTEEQKAEADIANEFSLMVDTILQMPAVKESDGATKFAFAGENADTADKMKLATAKKMLADGVDSETIRQETGWFKGYDGEWRFEINDLQMDVSTAGKYTRDPKIKRYLDLMNKAYFEMTASEEDLAELKKLDASIGSRSIAPGTLGDLIYHPLLFKAYSELENVKIRFEDGLNDTRGVFNPDFNEIVLSKSLKTNPKQLKKTLIHEIQHAVQHIEGFAKGSSPEYWNRVRKEAIENVSGARANLDLWLEDIGYPQFAKESMSRVVAKEITLAEHWKALDDFKKNSKYARQIANSEKEVAEYERRLSELNSLGDGTWATPKEMYFATAGEVEARDAADRSEFTEEQRKNTRPDIDQEDVVFANGSVSYYAAKDKSAENESTKEQLRNHLDEINEMEPVANVKYHVINKEKSKQDAKDFYKSKGYKVDRQNFGIIEMGENEVELSSNYANTSAEFAAWMTIPNVLKRGKLISGHKNHKGEGFPTYTFAAPVVINGERGVVAAVVRKTGKYRYKMHRILMPDGSIFAYQEKNENAELTGSDILLNKKEKGPDISSASNNSIPQKSDLSTDSAKKTLTDTKFDLADEEAAIASDMNDNHSQAALEEFGTTSDIEKTGFVLPDGRQLNLSPNGLKGVYHNQIARIYNTLKGGEAVNRFIQEGNVRVKASSPGIEISADKPLTISQYNAIGGFIQKSLRTRGVFYVDITDADRKEVASITYEENYSSEDVKYDIKKYYEKGWIPNPRRYKYDLADSDLKAEKRIEKLEKEKVKAQAKAKQERSMREKMAYEAAQAARVSASKVYTKQEIKVALDGIEALTDVEILSLAKGLELKGMTKARRDELISKIYILLHSASARGEAGKGSVAVKMIATKIAWDVIDTAKIVDENGKEHHIVDIYDEASVQGLAAYLADSLYMSFANMGEHTSNSFFQSEIRRVKEEFNHKFLNNRKLQKFTREISFQGKKLRDIAAHQKREGVAEGLGKVTKALASVVDPKGNVSVGRIDKAMKEAASFLEAEENKTRSERSQLSDYAKVSESADVFNNTMKFMVDEFNSMRAGREGEFLTAEEAELLGKILRGMKITIERYNKEYINGHWEDVDQAAADEVKDLIKLVDIEHNKEYKTKIGKLLGGKLGKGINEVYFYKILSPEYVLGALEGYSKGGLIQSMYHTIREAQQKSAHLSLQMTRPLIDFIDDKENRWESDGEDGGKKGHKYSFRNKLNTKTISVNGSELTLGEAIYLLMLTKREESHAGLLEGGYIVFDKNNQRRLKVKLSDIDAARDMIYNQLDKTDIEFLSLAENFFNKTASKIKYDADMKIFGFSNNSDGYYVPMIRDRYSRVKGVTDGRFTASEIVSLYSPSFTKNLVDNANALEGKNIMEIINNHADGLADYSEMYLPLKAFDRVYNRGVVTDDGVRSIREVLNNNVWNGTETYLKDLFKDIQHQSDSRDNVVDKLVGKIRSGWVSSVLGANIKVVMTQTTSLGAATQVIEPKYIIPALSVVPKFKGETINALRERAYKYSDIIEARVFDMGALKAQGNVEKVGEIGKKSGILIEKMDEQVCLTIFHAAELKAEALTGHAVGTEENARAAAKIADEAIFTTQAMTAPAEKSALQRSPSEVAKTLSMFTSDVTKNLSHLWGNTMKYFAHKQRANAGDAEYEAMLKEDAKTMRRSMRTLGITGLMMGLITYLFKWLYAKEEEEPEDRAKDFALDIFSSTFNIFPIVSDVFDKFVFNYDVSLNVFDMVNDTIESTANMFRMAGNAMSGKFVSDDDIKRNSASFIKSIGGAFGIPIAPVERTVTGLLRRFSPATIYGYDSAMYTTNYTADLKKAVESGDDRLAEHVIEQLYKDQVSGTYTVDELDEIVRLYSLTDESGRHYNVLPQQIGTTVNDVNLNAKQRKQFRSIYSQASAKVNALIRSAEYKALTDEQRAKAIKNVYALYYNRAASEVAGKEISNAQMYSWLTDNYSALFVSQAYKSGLSAVKDANGEEISVRDQFVEYAQNLGLSEGDYLVVAFANGVRDKQTKAAFIEYINSLKLSDEQKATIAEKLSLEIKNGKLSEKKE